MKDDPSDLSPGYLIHLDNLAPVLSWMSWLSYLRYGFAASMLVEIQRQIYDPKILAERALGDPENKQWLDLLLVFLPEVREDQTCIMSIHSFVSAY